MTKTFGENNVQSSLQFSALKALGLQHCKLALQGVLEQRIFLIEIYLIM
jgi:SAM-dependent MidA family methyltransferase